MLLIACRYLVYILISKRKLKDVITKIWLKIVTFAIKPGVGILRLLISSYIRSYIYSILKI